MYFDDVIRLLLRYFYNKYDSFIIDFFPTIKQLLLHNINNNNNYFRFLFEKNIILLLNKLNKLNIFSLLIG